MDKLQFKEAFDRFHNTDNRLNKLIKNNFNNRDNFVIQYKKELKKIFPIKNKLYQIINYLELCNEYYFRNIDKFDEFYFFKPTNTSFFLDCYGFYDIYPTVKGDLLDYNFKVLQSDLRIDIYNLQEITTDLENEKNKHTKIYLMIDKNTGFYKIGRSTNPSHREKTLQSEKPTIEMLFFYDAIVSDEKVLHDKFKDKRIRGEWFDLSGSDILNIKNYFENNLT